MRILHITQSLDPAWGGIASVLPALAGRLAAAGLHCRIAVLRGDRFGTPADVPGIDVLAFAAKCRSPLGRSPEFDARIGELVGESDIVHLHGLWAGQNWSAGKAARRQRKPIVISPHSHMMPWAWRRSAWKKRPVGWLFEHRNLRTAVCLHALAEGEAAHMRRLGFNRNVVVIPNGLDADDYATLPNADSLEARFPDLVGRKWLLVLGRIAEQKGIFPAMAGMLAAIADREDWQIVVAGPDPFHLRPRLETMIADANLRHRVTFTGMLDRDDVRACLGRASILVQPSFSEGLSMSILEALAAGLPVLLSEGCNMPEVATADAGRVVHTAPEDIERGLRELMTMSDTERATMGERARQLVRSHFDWKMLIPRYVRMYEQVREECKMENAE